MEKGSINCRICLKNAGLWLETMTKDLTKSSKFKQSLYLQILLI